jgi:L-asparaginase / beta-aspartyl-peptidase
MSSNPGFSLMVHGGAGSFDQVEDHESGAPYLESLRRILDQGRDILQHGGSAIEAVESCACSLEDDPLFNAGRGSVLNEYGRVEMDAAIMDGVDLSAGAVAAISGIANPVQLARRVMNQSGHVMLIGEGALQFAAKCGIPKVPENYFLIPKRVDQLEKIRLDPKAGGEENNNGGKFGTIGAVARDISGNLAAATSTGGTLNKRLGRVGDSPLIGAGVFADNETCAISATGHGEEFMRSVLCKMISDWILMRGMDAMRATEAGIDYFTRRIRGRGGVIVIDRAGNCASGFTTPKMVHGWIEHGGETKVRF